MRIQKILEKSILAILFAFLAIIVVFALVRAGLYETKMYSNSIFSLFIVIVLASFLFVLFYRVSAKINSFSDKKILINQAVFWGVIIIIQLIWVAKFDVTQITDALMVNDEARSIAKGITSKISDTSPYFAIYQNNDFAVIIQVLFYKIVRFFGFSVENNNLLELFNVLFIDSAIFFLWRTAKIIKGSKFALKVLLFSLLNPFNYLLIFWSYTLVYSLPLTFLIVYLGVILLHKEHKLWQKALLCGLIVGFTIIGYYIRPTIVIPTIALFVYWVLRVEKKKPQIKSIFIIVLAIVLASAISIGAVKTLHNKYTGTKSDRGFPLTHWVMMGLSEDGKITADDFYITFSEKDSADMSKADIKEIKRRMSEYNVGTFTRHIAIKLATTWSDGTGNFKWFVQADKKQSRLWNWIGGDRNDLFMLFCQAFRLFVLLLTLYNVALQIRYPRKYKYRPIFGIILFGAILFYLIWEAKELYGVPFIPFMFILGTYGIEHIERKETALKPIKVTSIAVVCATLILGTLGISSICYKTHKWKDYSISTEMNRFFLYKDSVSTLSKDNMRIKQSFIPAKDFSAIEIQCDPIVNPNDINQRKLWNKLVLNNPCKYIVTLTDDQGNIIKKKTVKAEDIDFDKGMSKIKFKNKKANEKYWINVAPEKAGEKDNVRWGWLKVHNTNQYRGQGYLNKGKIPDINIKVYKEYLGPYTTLLKYLVALGIILLIEILLAISYRKK